MSEKKGLRAGKQQTAKRPHSGNGGHITAEHIDSFPTKRQRKKRWDESEISDEEEWDDDIKDPEYLPGSDSDEDDHSTNRLAKSKLASAEKSRPGHSRTSTFKSTTVRGKGGEAAAAGGGKRRGFCFLCQKEYPKIESHLKTHISEDADVAQAFSLPAGSRQRQELLEKLRNRRNSLPSSEVPNVQSEEKMSAQCTNEVYTNCIHCKEMFPPSALSTHMMSCSSKPQEKQPQGGQPEPLTPPCSGGNIGLLTVLGRTHADVERVLSSDFSLQLFSKSLYSLHGHDAAKHDFIRQKILELGRFLLALQKTSPALTLADAVKPGNFLDMVKVVKEVTGFDKAQDIPSLALRIGQSLFEVSDIVQCHALLVGDQDQVNSATEFKKLYQAKWSEYISQRVVVDLTNGSPVEPDNVDRLDEGAQSATTTLNQQTGEQNRSSPARQQTHQTTDKPTKLPPAEDVGKLHSPARQTHQTTNKPTKLSPAEDVGKLHSPARQTHHTTDKPTKLPPAEDVGKLHSPATQQTHQTTDKPNELPPVEDVGKLHSPARQQTHQTTDKPTKLPSAEDIGKLHSHLDRKAESASAALKEQPTVDNYSNLARATLSKMVLLNAGCSGQLSRMKLRDFLERECPSKLVEVGLTEYEQKLCRYFQRVGLKGSDRRQQAVLLTPPLVDALDLMVAKRRECGVLVQNDYLFAIPECPTHYLGGQNLRLFAAECGAKKLEYLRSVPLCKQVAMASRIVCFRDNELDQLTAFLGQEITVQRTFCWLLKPTKQSARIEKLLLALEMGKLPKVTEKSPNDIGDDDQDEKDKKV